MARLILTTLKTRQKQKKLDLSMYKDSLIFWKTNLRKLQVKNKQLRYKTVYRSLKIIKL